MRLSGGRKEYHIPGLLLAAPSSGSGKTAVSCALMSAFKQNGKRVCACKCGPDYIDPMFHREVLGLDSQNLDLFFSGREQLKCHFILHSSGYDIAVAEGVMGYYDGMALDSGRASSYDVARSLHMPVILVLPAQGAALTLAAVIKGMAEYRQDSGIKGVLLNRVSSMLYPRLKKMLEQELKKVGLDIPVVGYLPENEAFCLESRHLGLVTPKELAGLKEQIKRAGKIAANTLDIEKLLAIAETAGKLEISETQEAHRESSEAPETHGESSEAPETRGESSEMPEARGEILETPENRESLDSGRYKPGGSPVRLAVAQDEAFCFYYKDNLELLRSFGCELIPFSPLKDKSLPHGISGLILGGGYPELYAERLSSNRKMCVSVKEVLENGMPALAECGGFMYLHEEIEDEKQRRYPVVGAIRGRAFPRGKLVRFGYVEISLSDGRSGEERIHLADAADTYLTEEETIKGHEFHYWDSTDNGTDCIAAKPDGKRSWSCIHAKGNLFAGYPHLYLPSCPQFARRFVKRCGQWKSDKETRWGKQ